MEKTREQEVRTVQIDLICGECNQPYEYEL